MLQLQKILFPTDFSACAERAFDHAAKIATLFDAEIHAFHTKIRQKDQYPTLDHLMGDLDDIDKPEQTIDFPNAKHDLVIQAGATDSSACNAIINYAAAHDIDLIVMGRHGRRGAKRLFLGSTAECVIRNASCPVLTLRSEAHEIEGDDFKHILVPVDFSNFAKESLQYANEFARLWKAKITLVHAIEEAVIPTVYGVEAMAFVSVEPLLKKSKREMQELANTCIDPSIEVDIQVLIGRPASVITEYAHDNGADLIILASHGLTGFKRFLMGSVAESLNRKASCAVLTVKPFGKSLLDGKTTEAEEAV